MLTEKQKAFAYGATVLEELEKAGVVRASIRIYSDTSCSLLLLNGTDENIRQLASHLLFSTDWIQEDIFFLRLDSKSGLLEGSYAMESSNA